MIEYDKYKKALKNLELQFANYRTLEDSLPGLMREAVEESVIQRFEVCYDCLWKVLKRFLAEYLGIPDLPNSPKPIFRIAAENHILTAGTPSDPLPIERWWMDYANARVDTSHDYSGLKAKAALALIQDFIPDAIALYQKMTSQPWK